jgi:hypothetical protein
MRQRLSAQSLPRMAITPPSASASRFPGTSVYDFADWLLEIMRGKCDLFTVAERDEQFHLLVG